MFLIVDANVLIDYAEADLSVLVRVGEHLAPVCVARDVLGEVERLDEEACRHLGIRVVDGTVEQIVEAGSRRGGLSFADRMCLILARDQGWTCVSNDRPLRRACEGQGVKVLWGFELMLELVRVGGMDADAAIAVAEAIAVANPWIGTKVVEAFRRKVREG